MFYCSTILLAQTKNLHISSWKKINFVNLEGCVSVARDVIFKTTTVTIRAVAATICLLNPAFHKIFRQGRNECVHSMDDSLLGRAFDVEIADDFDPSVPPSDGHEYLQHVMYEASKCPQIVVAEVDRKKLKNHVNINLEFGGVQGNELAPSADWQRSQIALFSELRKKVEMCRTTGKFKTIALPKPFSEEKWFNLCFGNNGSGLQPTLSLMLSMSEIALGRLLEYQVEWLECGLRPNQGKWIYAILACLSLPLTPAICSLLRDLARECAKIRCSKNSNEDEDVTILNLIICLVTKYFGQVDLGN